MKPVYITGSSVVTALADPANVRSSAPSTITLEILGQPRSFPYYCISEPGIDSGVDRMFHITRKVVAEAIADAGLTAEQLEHTALFVGSTSYSIFYSEQNYSKELLANPEASPIGLTAYEELTNFIRSEFLPSANSFTFHTACTSSVNALMYASKMIATGKIRHALIVGLEFFNQTTLLGFHSLDLVSKSRIQPFGIDRDGIILGEGCSALVISADRPAASNPIVIRGGATTVDIDSMTTVKPDGSTIAAVITAALDNADMHPEDIDAIKLHATASYSNDNAESAGLIRLFGGKLPPLVALKPCIGHTLGACGTNEIVILSHYLKKGLLPGIPYAYPFDPELGISIPAEDFPTAPGNFLLNHFGFGGNNTAIVISNKNT